MFSLQTKAFPGDASALARALEESLRRFVRPAGEMVTITGEKYPQLAMLHVSLDGASLRKRPPCLTMPNEPATPALTVDDFKLSGRGLRASEATFDLLSTARGLVLGQARDESGDVVLVFQSATEGSIDVFISAADLESFVRAVATAAAGPHGVAVEEVRLRLHAQSERALAVEAEVKAKKLFLSASVRISGRLTIDEKLVARLSDLHCAGEGPIGSLACNFLAPHLERFNNRAFSLLALPLGAAKLRDVKISADENLRITARFGDAA